MLRLLGFDLLQEKRVTVFGRLDLNGLKLMCIGVGHHTLVDVLFRGLHLALDHHIGEALVELETLGMQSVFIQLPAGLHIIYWSELFRGHTTNF